MVRFFLCLLTLFWVSASLMHAARAEMQFDPVEIEQWADDYIGDLLERKQIVGASLGVIQNGQPVFVRGYGWQDIKAQIPIDPSTTRFRMCSTSKTVMATSMMQLLERGQIASLDDPANKYLKRYQLPAPYGDKVTIRQLLTHSSGMAGHFTPQGAKEDIPVPVSKEVIEEFFRENIQREPGTIGQYANLGVALEGLIVEDVSGLPLATYIERNLFNPLGMDTALFHHSVTPPPNLAQPYAYFPDGSLQLVPFYPKHPLTAASGGFVTTTEDMLKYVALHADETGAYQPDVLSAAARQEMHSRQFAHHPLGYSVGLHFFRDTFGDERVVHHGCGLPGTFSMMGVLPDSNAGFVVTFLSASPQPSIGDQIDLLFKKSGRLAESPEGPTGSEVSSSSMINEFFKAVIGPRQKPTADGFETPDDVVDDPEKLVGNYMGERRSFTSFSSVFGLMATRKVEMDDDGRLLISGKPQVKVAEGVYDNEKGNGRHVFRQPDPNGPVFLHTNPANSYRQMAKGLSNPVTASMLLAGGWVVSLLSLLAIFWRRSSSLESTFKFATVLLGVSAIAQLFAMFAGYDTMTDIIWVDFFNGDLGRMAMVLGLVNLYALLGGVSVAAAAIAWTRGLWGPGLGGILTRTHLSVIAAASIATWPALVIFNLIGLQF